MSKFPRRTFIAGLSAIPFALWFEKYAAAAPPMVRYSLNSLNGRKMAKLYANAVRSMMNTPEASPVGWLFQWYTHNVRADKTKTGEINRIYPGGNSAPKSLAQDMWDTCQAHFGRPEQYFLPWHRMYVYFFERIVRKASGHTEFTLPYWNYSVNGPTHGILPSQFRMQGDPTFGSLFVQKRNTADPTQGTANVNAGDPIDKNDPGALDLGSLGQCQYLPQGAIMGFNKDLDRNLHGNVHVLVGNTQNMGSIPWAAFDPIFYIHHCNIDRLWASWNRAGRQNPTANSWLTKQFVFADENGNRVVATIKDFQNIAPLKYTYDRFEPVPACPAAKMGPEAAAAQQTRAIAPSGAVELSSAPIQVSLEAPPGPEAASVSLKDRVKQLKPGKHLYVVAKNLRADVQPGVLYHVYFDLPPGTKPKPGKRDPHYIGTLNFFDAMTTDHGGGSEAMASDTFLSFDATRVAKNLHLTKRLSTKPTLTIAPAKQPEADAKPVVGEITVVEQ